MMVCQKCGHKLEEGMEYCKFCGTHQEIFEEEFERKSCKFCKKNIPVNANFCSYCGKDQAFINVETFQANPLFKKFLKMEKYKLMRLQKIVNKLIHYLSMRMLAQVFLPQPKFY